MLIKSSILSITRKILFKSLFKTFWKESKYFEAFLVANGGNLPQICLIIIYTMNSCQELLILWQICYIGIESSMAVRICDWVIHFTRIFTSLHGFSYCRYISASYSHLTTRGRLYNRIARALKGDGEFLIGVGSLPSSPFLPKAVIIIFVNVVIIYT